MSSDSELESYDVEEEETVLVKENIIRAITKREIQQEADNAKRTLLHQSTLLTKELIDTVTAEVRKNLMGCLEEAMITLNKHAEIIKLQLTASEDSTE